MNNCKDIENNLSLYLDNLLSPADKRVFEEHLESCPQCGKALAQLQKTGKLVDGLGEVEPPLWFKHRIMARVREEAEKKSFAQKWFYPLRIKIPIQVFATIFITVLAVYIYRAGEQQMKAVLPPAAPTPVIEAQKDKLSEQTTKLSDADKTVVKKKISAEKGIRDEEMVMHDVSPGSGMPKTQKLKKAMLQENVRAGAADMAKAVKEDATVNKEEANYAVLSEKQAEPAKSMPSPGVALERKKEGYVLGAAVKQSRTPEAQSLMPKTTISVRVENINSAVGEVEKLLAKYEAKKIVRQMLKDKAVLTVELKAQDIKNFIEQLKTIGQVEEKELSAISNENNMLLVIEILGN
jgi:hypothetical protein